MIKMKDASLQYPIDEEFVDLFNKPGPYFTSYPTLAKWPEDKESGDFKRDLERFFEQEPDAPIWFYVHLPYCAKLCYYCICNIIVTNNRDRIQSFVDVLLTEINNLADFFKAHGLSPNIKEVHFGGGTPSHLTLDQLHSIKSALDAFCQFERVEEFSMEIDPRTVQLDDLDQYKFLGVDRISFGVQDFTPVVQEAINRVQPFELVENLVNSHIRKHFNGVNFDLLYGLPFQTIENFQQTIDQTITLSPDRIALLKYAHIPEKRKHMRMINQEDLPDETELAFMFSLAKEAFVAAGYEWVGIDNFVKPSDNLGKANQAKTIFRNFSGYSPGRAPHVLGVGPTTTHMFGSYYYQSKYDLKDYMKTVQDGEFPVFKGYELNKDDLIRRECIFDLQCYQYLDVKKIEEKYDIDFQSYFSFEISLLKNYENLDLLTFDADHYHVTHAGRYHVRHICCVFDKEFQKATHYRVHGP